MKPLQIGLLVIAGAVAGAVVMKVWQRPGAVVPAAVQASVAARVETPPPAPAPAVEPVPVPAPSVEVPEARPVRVRPVTPTIAVAAPQRVPPTQSRRPDPAIVAASEPTAPPVVAPAPEPPPPPPPARTEPEKVTPAPPPPAPEPEPPRVTLNAGILIPVRLVDGLSSERNVPGDTFHATLDRELVVDGFVIAERGARVEGRVAASDRGGKVKGIASLSLELTRLHTSDGQNVTIQTETFERRAESSQNTDAAKVAGGAAIGAIIGAIAGGGKGAAVGAGVGGGAGAGDVLLTRGKPATLPSETRLSFRLRLPVTLTEHK